MKKYKWVILLPVLIVAFVVGAMMFQEKDDFTLLNGNELSEEKVFGDDLAKENETSGTNPDTPMSGDVDPTQEMKENSGSEREQNADGKDYYIHVCGAVMNPGVYPVTSDSRIFEAIELAGGFREDAATDYLNLAEPLTDGLRIYVPTKEEISALNDGAGGNYIHPNDSLFITSSDANDNLSAENSGPSEGSGLVNINTAGKDQLCTLPGIGESKAQKIISYRESNGPFQRIEDIMKIPGIKEGLFQKVRDHITV